MTTTEIKQATFHELNYWYGKHVAADQNAQDYNAEERKKLGIK